MREELVQYIKDSVKKIKKEGDFVFLQNVYPDIVEEALGDFIEPYDLNGYDCDYWVRTDKYFIFGTMRDGTAKIQLQGSLLEWERLLR